MLTVKSLDVFTFETGSLNHTFFPDSVRTWKFTLFSRKGWFGKNIRT